MTLHRRRLSEQRDCIELRAHPVMLQVPVMLVGYLRRGPRHPGNREAVDALCNHLTDRGVPKRVHDDGRGEFRGSDGRLEGLLPRILIPSLTEFGREKRGVCYFIPRLRLEERYRGR